MLHVFIQDRPALIAQRGRDAVEEGEGGLRLTECKLKRVSVIHGKRADILISYCNDTIYKYIYVRV